MRSKQNTKKNWIYSVFFYLIKKYMWKIVSIDNDVSKTSYYKEITFVSKNFLNINKKQKIDKRKKSKFIISYVGTLIESKGILNLKKIASKIKKNKNIHFYVFGNIPKLSFKYLISKFFYNPYINPNSINLPNVYFFGEKNSLAEIYQNSDMVIFCSNLNAIGRPVLEAAIFKKTSIVFLDDRETDYIVDNKTGFLIKNKNINQAVKKILFLFNNQKTKNRMGNNAYKFVKNNFNVNKNFNIFKKEILLKI
jgi:glycosyltransferase involved in cell wall biosynthesis